MDSPGFLPQPGLGNKVDKALANVELSLEEARSGSAHHFKGLPPMRKID